LTPLTFPAVSRPTVSIVMATFGGREWVRKSLAAVIQNTDHCYEMIIVDNASPDGLATWLFDEVRNARIFRNSVNRGFGAATNQGAGTATGEALVLLNSDAFVHPGWLPPLLEGLERDGSTAAVAPCLWNVDGSLQEAGSLLFRNGYTRFYGFGDDPTRPEYRFARVIDYSSAACLLVRRRDFFAVGGFDTAYAPAYFEDVDLCLSLAARGLKIVYEPRSTVTHVRGASADERTAVQYWSRNLPVFEKRWSHKLASRPADSGSEDNPRRRLAARDAVAPARLLFATERFPGPPGSTGDPRALWLLRELSDAYPDASRTLLCPGEAPADLREPILAMGIEVASPAEPEPWLEARAFHYDVVMLAGEAAVGTLPEVLERTQPQAYRVVDLGSADLLSRNASGGTGTPPRRRHRGLEALLSADVVLTSARSDLTRVRAVSEETPCFLLSTPFEVSPDAPGFSERRNLLFLRASKVEGDRADSEALGALVDGVMPLIRPARRELELIAALRVSLDEASRLEREGIRIVPPGSESGWALGSARVLLAPFSMRPADSGFLRAAVAAGLPFVLTPEAAGCLPFDNLPRDAVARDLSELAEKALALDRDERRWTRLRTALARAFRRASNPAVGRRSLVRAFAHVGLLPPRPGTATGVWVHRG
jgi:GT2 family glycosyltransferase